MSTVVLCRLSRSLPQNKVLPVSLEVSYWNVCVCVCQENRRAERAEQQRVRAEKERDRQTRIAVGATGESLINIAQATATLVAFSSQSCVVSLWSALRRSARGRRMKRQRREQRMRQRRRKFCPTWEHILEAFLLRFRCFLATSINFMSCLLSTSHSVCFFLSGWVLRVTGRAEKRKKTNRQRNKKKDSGRETSTSRYRQLERGWTEVNMNLHTYTVYSHGTSWALPTI